MLKTAKLLPSVFVILMPILVALELNANAQSIKARFYETAEKVGTYIQEHPKISICGAFLAGSSIYALSHLNSYLKIKNPLSDLIKDPVTALRNAMQVNEQFKERETVRSLSVQDIKKRISLFEQKSPIFLLGECTSVGSRPCEMSRFSEPAYRNAYENCVVRALVNKMTVQEAGTVHYASFASGGMFQDLVILTKALNQKRDGSLMIHLIDLQYRSYVNFFEATRQAGCDAFDITNLASVKFTDEQKTSIGQYFRPKGSFENKTDKEIFDKLYRCALMLAQSCKQLLTVLQQNFPEARVLLTLHSSKDAYCTYLDGQSDSCPDVLVAADFQDQMSQLKESVLHYAQLCQTVLMKKSEMQNIALYLQEKNKPALVSFSLAPASTAQSSVEPEDDLSAEVKPISLFSSRVRPGCEYIAMLGAGGLCCHLANKYVQDPGLKEQLVKMCGAAYMGWALPYFYNDLDS